MGTKGQAHGVWTEHLGHICFIIILSPLPFKKGGQYHCFITVKLLFLMQIKTEDYLLPLERIFSLLPCISHGRIN